MSPKYTLSKKKARNQSHLREKEMLEIPYDEYVFGSIRDNSEK